MKWWTFWQSKEFIRKELVLFTNFEDINELNERNAGIPNWISYTKFPSMVIPLVSLSGPFYRKLPSRMSGRRYQMISSDEILWAILNSRPTSSLRG
ncbi:hypothetical protein AAC387_Pa04g2107 [Persea americana]